MTKTQKLRRNSFAADFNAREDDFILADLDVMLDEEDPSPVPLNHFLDDEETIDRLLINSGFEANDQWEEDNREPDALVIDNIDLTDECSGLDQFVIEPLEQTEQRQQAEIEEISVSDFHLMADFDEIANEEDAIDRLLVNAGFDANGELKNDHGVHNKLVIDDISRSNECGVNFEEQSAMVADTGILDSEESELALDKNATHVVSGKQENPDNALQEQAMNETTYPEEALESLKDDAGIAAMNLVKNEQEAIKKQIIDYEVKVKKAATLAYIALGFGIVALLSTVVMGVIVSGMQTKVSKLTELVSILEEDMSGIAGKNPDLEINNSGSSIEQLNQKIIGIPEQIEGQTESSPGISENVEKADVTKPATVNNSNDKQQNKMPVPENNKSSEGAVNKLSAEKKGNKIQQAAGWSVNLTAYEDLNYAKRKAENFIQKGIPVKVIAVDMNNTKWYRLKVGGFKSEEEATSYAAKIKKSLNLNTVFVGKN